MPEIGLFPSELLAEPGKINDAVVEVVAVRSAC